MKPSMFGKYIHENLISFLQVESREEALYELVQLIAKEGKISHKEEFYHAILERERIVSTGIGMGVAIPHAKLSSLKEFFIAIGIQKKDPLDWDSIDKAPVKLIFMIGGPEDCQKEYLQILSFLTMAIKDEKLRKRIILAEQPKKVFEDLIQF